MWREGRAPTAICQFLREDTELAAAVPAERRHSALRDCIAPVKLLPVGPWAGDEPLTASDGIGLLVLSGLLMRSVGVDGCYGAELLGEGDLLRPGQEREGVSFSLSPTTRWRVLEPARVALLDARVARRVAQHPELTERLVQRALARAHSLAVNLAIIHRARVDVRLHLLFWHLADRWGYVAPTGVVLPLELTHSMLADLVAARRPTVSSALAELARAGRVEQTGAGWLVRGERPQELPEVHVAGAAPQPDLAFGT